MNKSGLRFLSLDKIHAILEPSFSSPIAKRQNANKDHFIQPRSFYDEFGTQMMKHKFGIQKSQNYMRKHNQYFYNY